MTPDDPEFVTGWEALLRKIGGALEQVARAARTGIAAD
jgi:hypothetical protein